MVRTVVFDLGKVLVEFDYGIAGRKLAERSRMPAAELGKFLVHVPLIIRYETGLISSEEFYQEVRAASGYTGDMEDFASLFADIFTPIDAMVSLQSELRRKGFPTFIFSNTNELAVRFIRRRTTTRWRIAFQESYIGWQRSVGTGSARSLTA